MLVFNVNGQEFEIEFRHRRKNRTRPERSELYAKSPVRAITACNVRGVNHKGQPYHAMGMSICIEPDNWSRNVGRMLAFEDAVKRCGMLRAAGHELGLLLAERFELPRTAVQSAKLPFPEVQLRYEEGSGKREARRLLRMGAQLTGEQAALVKTAK